VKRQIIALLACGMVIAAPAFFVFAKNTKTQPVPAILMYHDVMDVLPTTDDAHKIMAISPTALEKQFVYLRENKYQTLFVSEAIQGFARKTASSEKTVVLTFDDGMQDMYDTVLPLIKKYRIKITVFANPGFDGMNGRMTHAMLRDLSQSGLVEIGAHTMTHENLIELADSEAWDQILNSKTKLQQIIGAPVVSFAYPFGAADARVENMVRRAGFVAAVVADDRFGRTYRDQLLLPRTMIGEQTGIQTFVRTLRGF
jgi:peptidoglycan/xylan/chitin deacetylase (PgdA/CDA1 family)